MSHDALYILKENNKLSFYYSRWGALGLPKQLLNGPDSTLNYISEQRKTATPTTYRWMCGFIFADPIQRHLVYWVDQFFASKDGAAPYFQALIAQQWPGWTVSWATQPIREVAALLHISFPELEEAEAEVAKMDYDNLISVEEDDWNRFIKGYEDKPGQLEEDIKENGYDTVRLWAETWNDNWVTVRWQDGTLSDYLLNSISGYYNPLLAGPEEMLRYLRQRRPLEKMTDFVGDLDLRSAMLLDEAARQLYWWWGIPSWISAAYWPEKLWPDWTVDHHNDGPHKHLTLTSRPDELITMPPDQIFQTLSEGLTRTLNSSFNPLAILSQIAQNSVEEIQHQAQARGEAPGELQVSFGFDALRYPKPGNLSNEQKLLLALHKLVYKL